MVEKKTKWELIREIAALMPGASEDEITRTCIAAGVWSEAELEEMAEAELELMFLERVLEMQAEGLLIFRDGMVYPPDGEA